MAEPQTQANMQHWLFLTELVKSVGWQVRLAPFFQAVAVYFWAGGGGGWRPLQAMVKVAPVASLAAAVALQPHDTSQPQSISYCCKIALGLILSGVGDVLLVWPRFLAAGMGAFAAAHCLYMSAFTFRPLCLPVGVVLFICTAIYNSVLTPPEALKYLVPIYSMFLASMAWRGVARARTHGRSGLAAAVGGVAFLVSDMVLAYTMFNGPVENDRVIVMSTYYFAQFAITLSAVELARRPAPHPAAPRALAVPK